MCYFETINQFLTTMFLTLFGVRNFFSINVIFFNCFVLRSRNDNEIFTIHAVESVGANGKIQLMERELNFFIPL
jgi:hypothetical protein